MLNVQTKACFTIQLEANWSLDANLACSHVAGYFLSNLAVLSLVTLSCALESVEMLVVDST